MIDEIKIETKSRNEMIDITGHVQNTVEKSGINEGIAIIFNPHTTAAITINEGADADVQKDILASLSGQYPHLGKYRHSEGNSDAHIKSALIGSDRTIPVQNSRLILGTWQRIFFCEFDGPRSRKLTVTIIAC